MSGVGWGRGLAQEAVIPRRAWRCWAGGGGDILAESPAGVLWAGMAARGSSTNTLDVGVIPTPGCLPGLGRGLTRIPSLPRKGRRAPFTGHTPAQVGNAEPFPRAGCWWRTHRESGDSKHRSPGTSGILDTGQGRAGAGRGSKKALGGPDSNPGSVTCQVAWRGGRPL